MLHPSYSDLMSVVNSEVEPGEQPLVRSRYSIVLATAKRARQLIGNPDVYPNREKKPLSQAVEELYRGEIKILADDELTDAEQNVMAAGLVGAEPQEVEVQEIESGEMEPEEKPEAAGWKETSAQQESAGDRMEGTEEERE